MKLGQKLKGLVGMVAPKLGMAVGGPFGAMAGKMIQGALGVDSEAAAVQALETDPEAFVKLKQAEIAFETRMAELGIEEEQLHAKDRASAREMASKTTIWPQVVLSALYTVAYIALLWAFVRGYANVPPEHVGLVTTLIGALGAAQLQILNFWFGSSSGSKEKTSALAGLKPGEG